MGKWIKPTVPQPASPPTVHAGMSSNRGAHLSVTLALVHNCCQSQLCVPDWHNNSLIPLTWSAFLFSLKLLSGTCPAGMDPKAISAPRHTPDTRRRLINPRDFHPDTNFQPLWQMSHRASVGHRQPSYVVSKLRSTDVGFWGQIRAFTFHHFQATSWEVFSVSPGIFLLVRTENSFTKQMDFWGEHTIQNISLCIIECSSWS